MTLPALEFDPEADAFLSREMVEWARQDIDAFVTAVMRDERTGLPLDQAPVHIAWHELAEAHDRLIIWSAIELGKCFGRGTPVLLRDGTVRPVEAILPGDVLVGLDGAPRRVLSTTHGTSQLYRIIPNKGDPWVCNAGHVLTLVHTTSGEVRDFVLEDFLRITPWRRALWKQFHRPVKAFAGEASLPVDPYFLGLWFGDGTKELYKERLRGVGISKPDIEVRDCCEAIAAQWGLHVSTQGAMGKCPTHRIAADRPGVTSRLLVAMRALLGPSLAVPVEVLRAPWLERAAFLAGFIDSDGYCEGGCIEIAQKRKDYAEAVCFVARSLGLRALMKPKVVKGQTYWRVALHGDFQHIPIRIERKRPASRTKNQDVLRTGFRVEPIGRGEYFGFTLDGDGRFLLGDFTVVHNTTQLSIARALFDLGRDPSLRIAIVSNTARQAEKVLRSIKRYIEHSPELHVIFPELRPTADQWASHSITVRRRTTSKDPSIQTLGIHGNILGARLDRLILDDLLDIDNTRTPHGREDCFAWVQANCLSRLDAEARVLVVGTAFHPEDALHRLARLPGFKAFRYPVVTDAGEPRWPERWPATRIQQMRDTLGPLEFARQLLCVARSDDEARFKKEWLDTCLARGNGKQLCYGMDKLPSGFKTYTGVDLAIQQKDASDLTCLFTIAAHPNGDREVLNIESGKWSGPEIVTRIIETHRRYLSICVVENNAAQDFIIQFARGQFAVPIRPFTTGRNKAHPEFGVESVAAEMAGKKWIIPSTNGTPAHPEIFAWLQEMLFYQPSAHTGDRLMASWFAREGVRLGALRVEGGKIDVFSR